MKTAYSVFPTPHGFLVLHFGAVVSGPHNTKREALAWLEGREGAPSPPTFGGAMFAGACVLGAALAFGLAALAIVPNLPAIGAGLVLGAFAAFIIGH